MSNNNEKIILDLCGGTGSWSKPYSDNGYDVRVITHPEHDLFSWDEYWSYIGKVYGILAAPTCTHFSLARTTAKTPRNLKGGFRLVKRCMEIVEDCRVHGHLKFWALENPMGYLRQLLGKPPLTFNPSDYGANYTKKTDLWGYYNFPTKSKRILSPEEIAACSINNRKLPDLPKDYVLPENFRPQQARRSMTDEFFARAFYKANR